jgi:hypothetical protein
MVLREAADPRGGAVVSGRLGGADGPRGERRNGRPIDPEWVKRLSIEVGVLIVEERPARVDRATGVVYC